MAGDSVSESVKGVQTEERFFAYLSASQNCLVLRGRSAGVN